MSNPHSPDQRAADPAAEIDAEIADHLATAAARLQAQGATPDEAVARAQQKFGDAATVRQRCYWIQQGDSLMFRGAVIVFLGILGLSLIVTAIGSWQSQVRMTQQMTVLTEQLKVLAGRPAAAPTMEQKPLELTGKVYSGSPDKPTANQEVTIVNFKDGSVVRRVTSDAQGRYRSGPLAAGDYCVIARIDPQRFRGVPFAQSPPTYVFPGALPAPLDFDVYPPTGRLAVELSRPLPLVSVADKYTIEARLMIKVQDTRYAQYSVWTAQLSAPQKWPVYLAALTPPGPEYRDKYLTDFYEPALSENFTGRN